MLYQKKGCRQMVVEMKANLKTIKQAIADPKTKVVSFDVFDTLLIRPFWFPTDLFFFLDKEIETFFGAAGVITFSSIRRDAEKKVREKVGADGIEDVTFQQIYDYIEATAIFPKETVQLMMQKELELELRFCSARKSAKKLVQFAVDKGKKVIATSDMYLPSDFIKKLLYKNGFDGVEEVFVSCESGLTKWTGKLYGHVMNHVHVSKHEIIHIGDNLKTDVKVPLKLGIRAFPYYRTIDLLAGENGTRLGKAFNKAYKQMRSPFTHQTALNNLGTRCMLAVAANRIFDNPFRINHDHGDYADDVETFGNLALGTYCMAHAMWLDKIAREENADSVLFFARDGFLLYKGFEQIQRNREVKVNAAYARSSRKALVPLLFSSNELFLTAGSHLDYLLNSPMSIVNLMDPVLMETKSSLQGKLGKEWNKPFSTELSMMEFLKLLYEQYVDKDKLEKNKKGYCLYFAPFMKEKIVTYDIGYSLRNEIMLRHFFPDVEITAACTHTSGDTPYKRGEIGNIEIRTFYPQPPYVTWLAREMFMIEEAPSCIGYSETGMPIMEEETAKPRLLHEMHEQALDYMEAFCSAFKEDVGWLPTEYVSACLPFEAFLHSPGRAASKWVKNLNEEDYFGARGKDYKSYNFWRELRTDYWIARHHLGKYGRHAVRFMMLTYTDREELKQLIKKRMPNRFKKHE